MLRAGELEHSSYPCENIIYEVGRSLFGDEDGAARSLVGWWMNSPGHRANILDAGYRGIGVGVAVERETVYATQNFAPCG